MTLSVLVNDRSLRQYTHEGKNFVEGWKGSEYKLRFQNTTSNRQKIIVSVDGLNVVSGDFDWTKGYVVEPYHDIDIPGWRKDADNVAKFVFSSLRSSYNQHNESGDITNIGVIGCMVFNEKKQQITSNIHHYHWNYPYYYQPYPYYPYPVASYWYPSYTLTSGNVGNGTVGLCGSSFTSGVNSSSSINMAQAEGHPGVQASFTCDTAPAAIPQNSVGTGWGENKEFQTTTVNYEFEPNPVKTILIYYDDRKGLERRGINLNNHKFVREPNAFPGDGCPPPINPNRFGSMDVNK